MPRWLEPRSAPARVVFQVLTLLVAAGAVYLFVTWLGADLVSAVP